MNLKQAHHVHFTGIKGVGMTALALCAQDLGIKVSGSDVDEPFVTDAVLKRRKINWQIGFAPGHVPPATNLLVYTAAHQGANNPEVQAARERGIATVSHAQALDQLMQGKIGISVCGVGGKTTTAAMLSHILDRLGARPSFCIGVGDIPSLGAPGRYDQEGRHFVAEADRLGLDWKLVAAIAGVESTFGHRVPRNSYNAWGWGIFTGKQDGIHFATWADGITTVSEGLKNRYVNRGAKTIEQIGRIYAASPTWSRKVNFFLAKIEAFVPTDPATLDVEI